MKIDDNRADFGSIVSSELKEELKEGIDYLDLVIPVGECVPFLTNVPGVPTPDSDIFQECNGSEIIHPASPLRSQGSQQNFTPDMRNRYVKVPAVFGQAGQVGGQNATWLFRHNHGGVTGTHGSPTDVDHSGAAREAAFGHNHTIGYSFNFAMDVQPPFYTLKWFMRIQ